MKFLKTPGQCDPEKGPLGHTPFRVNSDPECGQLYPDLTNKEGQIDPALGHIPSQVDWFPDQCWLGMELAPMDPFPGQVWPGCF